MKFTKHLKHLVVAALPLLVAAAPAHADVFGIQALLGRIVTVDPTTGNITNSYATPDAISRTQGNAGLSYAAGLDQLLYIDTAIGNTLYRLDPRTGATLGTAVGSGFTLSGLSYQRLDGTDYLYYGHQNVDIHRQAGFGGTEDFFFNQPSGTGNPTEGLGGDGYGRAFVISSDGIHEYDPRTGQNLNVLSQFTPGNLAIALGLAYDGNFLYASTSLGTLLTIDPNTGALVRSVIVAGGSLIELGARGTQIAAVPEPATVALLGAGLLAIGIARRRRASLRPGALSVG